MMGLTTNATERRVDKTNTSAVDAPEKVRNVLFVLLATVLFLLKRQYSGPFDDVVHAYAGNVCISWAVYFLFANLRIPPRSMRLLTAASAFAVVQLFEALDGFGIMTNTYDPLDFFANTLGIALGLWLDTTLAARKAKRIARRGS